jgi:hypothetical protein
MPGAPAHSFKFPEDQMNTRHHSGFRGERGIPELMEYTVWGRKQMVSKHIGASYNGRYTQGGKPVVMEFQKGDDLPQGNGNPSEEVTWEMSPK